MIIEYDEKKLRRIKRGACLAVGGIGLLLGAFGIAYACTKYRNIEKMVSDATSHISKLTSINVEDSIIEKAVADSASHQIDKAVSKAVSAIKNDISIQSRSLIEEAVAERYGKIESVVINAVDDIIAKNVDVESLCLETMIDAKQDMVEKLVEKMEDIFDEDDYKSLIRMLLKVIE